MLFEPDRTRARVGRQWHGVLLERSRLRKDLRARELLHLTNVDSMNVNGLVLQDHPPIDQVNHLKPYSRDGLPSVGHVQHVMHHGLLQLHVHLHVRHALHTRP